MKIAMIGQKGLPATYGGIEVHVDEVARRLVARGHEISVYCREDYTPAGLEHHGIRLLRRWSHNTKHLGTPTHVLTSTLDALIRDYDVVHFHALGPSIFSFLPRLRGQRTVVTVHGLDWQREKWGAIATWILRRCEVPAIRFPDRTIVVSRTLQEYFRSRHGKEPIHVPNGTNLPEPAAPRALPEMGLEAGEYLLFVGRLVPEKGVHYLTEAFERVETGKKLVIAGGYAFSPEYQSQLSGYASDRVRFLGFVHGERLAELWSNAYLVVQPSTMEGLSIALLEALSYGRCVLVSDIPENLEVADECAVPFRSRDVEDLRAKLQRLIDRPDEVRSYEAKARRHVQEQFSWDRVADRHEAIYRELIEGPAAG